MRWCEANRVEYVFGLARNSRLEAALVQQLAQARELCLSSGRPARVFRDFTYRTLNSWSRSGGSSERPGKRRTEPIRALSSPCSNAPAAPIPARSTKTSIAPEARPEPHRRAVRAVRRSRVLRHDGGQPAADVVLGDGLRAGRHVAPRRSALHSVRRCLGADHPSQAAQARRPGAHQRATHSLRIASGCPNKVEFELAYIYLQRRSAPPDGRTCRKSVRNAPNHDARRRPHA